MSPADIVMQRIEVLGKISDEPQSLTRTFCSPAMRKASNQVARWMREAGMSVREDSIGNRIGRIPGNAAEVKTFLLGSHLDTVRDAGKFDGPLGILVGVACVEHLRQKKIQLPFAIEVVAFADEEGVRYQTAYLGSKVLAGNFPARDLKRIDANGVTMTDAISRYGGNPAQLESSRMESTRLVGYAEVHIEQGPVLEKNNLAVGVVSAIAGQTRGKINFIGRAGHAGTTPMNLRKDALCAAAEFILGVEHYAKKIPGLVATVGQLATLPGASNVIPARVHLSLDVRHQSDAKRNLACQHLERFARKIAQKRHVFAEWEIIQSTNSVPCLPGLSNLLAIATAEHQGKVLRLSSGAGHDAAVIAAIAPVAMLFVRCRGGVSHHPDESVKKADVRMAISVMNEFLQLLAKSK
ncbi:MAG: allantoate amidohydrolase [Verrucomicrobiota bacterium]